MLPATVHLVPSELESSVDHLSSTRDADSHHESSYHLMGMPGSGPSAVCTLLISLLPYNNPYNDRDY